MKTDIVNQDVWFVKMFSIPAFSYELWIVLDMSLHIEVTSN